MGLKIDYRIGRAQIPNALLGVSAVGRTVQNIYTLVFFAEYFQSRFAKQV